MRVGLFTSPHISWIFSERIRVNGVCIPESGRGGLSWGVGKRPKAMTGGPRRFLN